jgi:ring-1,2-phenylacetyl-CoA epoxidase subunit PaaB
MKVYEVFLKKAGKDEFRHAGALEAPDAEMALMYGRESYARRAEGAEMWLVERSDIIAADPDFIAVNEHKPHRHNDGSAIADRRKRKRAEEAATS